MTFALKGEEDLSARPQPNRLPLSAEGRVPRTYRDNDDLVVDLILNNDSSVPQDVLELDGEGHAIVLDFGLFVLANFHRLFDERLRILRAQEREIIVAGDINACSMPLGHCDFMLASTYESFFECETRGCTTR
ncbi:hypothetical protein AURDEDRAFT_162758 [Auricularia subglabra TFB-10046 SS5]|nr:hypothetical protein AURDEDRAFT_162758 [Auricularia subglabra TFB-10046 SS5]